MVQRVSPYFVALDLLVGRDLSLAICSLMKKFCLVYASESAELGQKVYQAIDGDLNVGIVPIGELEHARKHAFPSKRNHGYSFVVDCLGPC